VNGQGKSKRWRGYPGPTRGVGATRIFLRMLEKIHISLIYRKCKCARGQGLSVSELRNCNRSAVTAQLTITTLPYGTDCPTPLKMSLPVGDLHPSGPVITSNGISIGSAVYFSTHERYQQRDIHRQTDRATTLLRV